MLIEIGKTLTIEVNADELSKHEAVFAHVVKIGLRNILMDAHASAKREDYDSDVAYRAASLSMSTKKLDALMKGELRTTVATRAPSDPVGAEAMRLARVTIGLKTRGWEKGNESAVAFINAAAKKLGIETGAKVIADYAKEVIQAAIKANAAREDVRTLAAANVEAAKGLTVDVDDML